MEARVAEFGRRGANTVAGDRAGAGDSIAVSRYLIGKTHIADHREIDC